MMNECRRKLLTIKVDHYDGQSIYCEGELFYELGGYLGGGAAGVVYEAFCTKTKRHVAMKILNPVGYKLVPSTVLSRCMVAVRGKAVETLEGSNKPATLREEHVWWLVHPNTKQTIAAYECPRTGMIRELTLPQCIEIWGDRITDQMAKSAQTDAEMNDPASPGELFEVQIKNQSIRIPKLPRKFLKFAQTRRSIHREISNMSGLGHHENVLRLEEALELVQDSKCTTFLVLELAAGGELFDRIKLDCGTDEETARQYFRQLVSGVAFCHSSGVCHRDLKPENLLLADNEEHSTLKIADFGLSAIFAITDHENSSSLSTESSNSNPDNCNSTTSIRRLRSVVGSPHYVAPEVLMDAGNGYDGAKADAWSVGVILYAMLAGNLPFGKDLLKCMRYDKFKEWAYRAKYSDDDPADEGVFPSWFFPGRFSYEVKSLIAQLLYPDACMRLSVEECQHHPWVLDRLIKRTTSLNLESRHQQSPPNSIDSCVSPVLSRSSSSLNHNSSQLLIDPDTRWISSGAASPQGGLFMRPSTHAAGSIGRSPQKPLARTLFGPGGYMPRLDEIRSMSGLTPVSSPRVGQDPNRGTEEDCLPSPDPHQAEKTMPLQFDFEDDLIKESEGCTQDNENVEQHSFKRSEGSNGACDLNAVNVQRQHLFRSFTSPPLALESRGRKSRQHHRRNSPPELFLSQFDKVIKLHEVKSEDAYSSLSSSPSTSDTAGSTQQSSSEEQAAYARKSLCTPPSYHDIVTRSTRFTTALPAQLVLSRIESILSTSPSPLPHPFMDVPQQLKLDWDNYQLEVCYGNVLICTVQVFLYERGAYLVEFRRGQMEIFQFKRFYEDIRERFSACVDSCRDPAFVPAFRKRNNSICMFHEAH